MAGSGVKAVVQGQLGENPSRDSVLFALTRSPLDRPHYPGWGLFYSVFIHVLVLAGGLLLPVFPEPPERPLPDPLARESQQGGPGSGRMVFYLPAVGGGKAGGGGGRGDSSAGSPGSGPGGPAEPAAGPATPAAGGSGRVHPGPQAMVSNPPSPDNQRQTLLRPDLGDLPLQRTPLQLPNLVSRAPSRPAPPPPAPASAEPEDAPGAETAPARPAPEEARSQPVDPEPEPQPQPEPAPPAEAAPPRPAPDPTPPAQAEQPEVEVSDLVVEFELPTPQPPEVRERSLVQPQLEDLSGRRQVEQTTPLPDAKPGFRLQPQPPKTAVGLPDTTRPEVQQRLDTADGAPVELGEQGLADLPLTKPPAAPPGRLALQPARRPPTPKPPATKPPPPQLPEPAEPEDRPPDPPETAPAQAPEQAQQDQARVEQRQAEPAPAAEETDQPLPEAQQAESIENPELEPPAPLHLRGKDAENLLVLTPNPVRPAGPLQVPQAEARGRFAISPTPGGGPEEAAPGSAPVENANAEAGLGREASGSPSAVVTLSWGGGGESDDSGGGGGAETGSGSGNSPGTGSGTGAGPGSGTASGSGRGAGTGAGSGRGAGSGPGEGTFEGITVVGGVEGSSESGPGAGAGTGISVLGGIGDGGPGSGGSGSGRGSGVTVVGGISRPPSEAPPDEPVERSPYPVATDYDISVISTESSGGGLPYYGVFSNRQIHTVYLDMRESAYESAYMWTMEFAEPQTGAGRQSFVKPRPETKVRPKLPPDLLSAHDGKLIVVYAVVNVDGGLEQLRVLESPDPSLNPPVLEALGKWTLEPGRLNGSPVEVEALLGIPLRLP